jgi:hypothetical protein
MKTERCYTGQANKLPVRPCSESMEQEGKSMQHQITKEPNAVPVVAVCLTWQRDCLPHFSPLLQQGFLLKARLNLSIPEILCNQFGLSQDYLRQRINTIFLDGKPVDDVDSAIIKSRSVLALSAAMPGFVGAAFRKGGFYAAMRRDITYVEESRPDSTDEGFFRLKLYNMVATELAPLFLNSGIFIESEAVKHFLENRSERFWLGCLKCSANGNAMDVVSFRERTWLVGSDFAHFRVVEDQPKVM